MSRKQTAEACEARTAFDAYIAAQPPQTRKALASLRQSIRTAAPLAEERISYRIPAYKYHGWLVFFAAFKNHNSFIVPGRTIDKFRVQLKGFDISGKTIHFTNDAPLPASLVRRIVKA